MAVKYANEIIVLSKGVKKYFKDTYNIDTTFIPNGVNKPKVKEADIITKKYGIKKDDYILKSSIISSSISLPSKNNLILNL